MNQYQVKVVVNNAYFEAQPMQNITRLREAKRKIRELSAKERKEIL